MIFYFLYFYHPSKNDFTSGHRNNNMCKFMSLEEGKRQRLY